MNRLIQDLSNKARIWITPRVQDALPAFFFPQRNLRFRAYCIGAPKTGTTTLALLFQQQFRAAHEAEASLVLEKILKYTEGGQDRTHLVRYLKHRDRRLGLEMDSSHLYHPILECLIQEFPDAKFILTLRDCYSWLDSLLNQHAALYQARGQQQRFHRTKWIRYYDAIFGAQQFQHAPEEQVLADLNLYTVDGFFKYWAKHNQTAIELVPSERLLVIRTDEIDQKLSEIEAFLQLPVGTLPPQVRGNSRANSQKLNLLDKIDPAFIDQKAQLHCQCLMAQYFPELQSIHDLHLGNQ